MVEEKNLEEIEKLREKKRKIEEEMSEKGIIDMFTADIRKFSKSAHIIIPKKYLDENDKNKAVILIVNKEKFNLIKDKKD